jgi:hypothetical protein
MKGKSVFIVMSIVFASTQIFAANGDLIVDGKFSIGTTSPTSSLNIGDLIAGATIPAAGSKVQINDTPNINTTGFWPTFHLVSQPTVTGDSAATNVGSVAEVDIPATANNYYSTIGMRGETNMLGTGTLTQQIGSAGLVTNRSTGIVTQQIGKYGFASNLGGGTVTTQYGSFQAVANNYGVVGTQYGAYGRARNNSTGGVGTSYAGFFEATNNNTTGSITTAYGVYTQLINLLAGGSIGTGYGVYVGNVQATSKWSLYASDATAPSYFAGNVGIGTTTPAYALDVQGQVASNGVALTSDAKFKKNVLSISAPLEKILQLNGVSYEWKIDEFKEKNFPEGRHFGVIAQEAEKVLPETVVTDAKGDKSVAYTEIIPVLIEAIKEQQKTIQNQANKLAELESAINRLSGR